MAKRSSKASASIDDPTLEPAEPKEDELVTSEPSEPSEPSEQPEEQETPAATASADKKVPDDSFVSVRDAARELGLDLSRYEDDDAAMRALVQQAQQAQQQQYQLLQLQYQLGELQKQQQTTPPPAPPEDPVFWKAPDFNPNWLGLVTRNDNGELLPNLAAGGTPDIVAKIQQYAAYRMQEQDRFWANPYSYLEPYLAHREQKVLDRVRELAKEEDARMRESLDASMFVRDNSQWLFARDGNGQTVMQGENPQLSAEGKAFLGFLMEAKDELNLPVAKQAEYAKRMLDAWRVSAGGGQPAPTNEQKKQEFISKHNPSRSASTHRAADRTGITPPQNPQQSLEQLMRANLAAAGITDEDLAAY